MKWSLFVVALVFIGCGKSAPSATSARNGGDSNFGQRNANVSADAFGVNAHRPRGDLAAKLFDKVKESGVQWARIDVSWDEIESAKGVFEWGKSDDAIRAASERGLLVYANIHNTPRWASGKNALNEPASASSDWANFCHAVAERYDGNHGQPKVSIFGVWNEPDGRGLAGESRQAKLDAYTDKILKPCSSAIKSVRPDARVAAPDLAADDEFLSGLLQRAKASIDIVSVHKYSDTPAGVVSALGKIRGIMRDKGVGESKPLWLTETGWSTKGKSKCWFDTVDDSKQAALITSLFDNVMKNDLVEKIFLYELKDDDSAGACQWGLLESDLSEKPAFSAVKKYMNALSDKGRTSGSSSRGVVYIPKMQQQVARNPVAQPTKAAKASIPEGSYAKTCDNIEVKNGVLYARCKKDIQRFSDNASLSNFAECRGDIWNDNGNLLCKK